MMVLVVMGRFDKRDKRRHLKDGENFGSEK